MGAGFCSLYCKIHYIEVCYIKFWVYFKDLIMINVFLFSLKTGGVAALYLLSPFDIVPEAAFGIFGLLDDLVIVALFLIYSSILYRNFVVQDDTWNIYNSLKIKKFGRYYWFSKWWYMKQNVTFKKYNTKQNKKLFLKNQI